MKIDFTQIKKTLDTDLELINQIKDPLERLSKSLHAVDNLMSELKMKLSQNGFEREEDEVYFFKYYKPAIVAIKIVAVHAYSLAVNLPIGTIANQLKYYEEEIEAINVFFRMNSYHYQYYKNHVTELDGLYFLRKSGPLTIPIADPAEIDPEFSTPISSLFGKFEGYERVQHLILEKIIALKYPQLTQPVILSGSEELTWTGDAVNVIELAYGIYLTGQLNHGNASLNQIVRWLEKDLKVNIGNIQSRFAEIGARKRLSPTRYLEQMQAAILQKIATENS